MKLAPDEQEMLDGRHGPAVQLAMELLFAVGECYGAEKMLPVTSAHLIAANPVNAGEAGARLIRDMAETGSKFVVPLTTNPACLEPWDWKEMGFSEELYLEQIALSKVLSRMGAVLCNTCSPYLIGHAPRMGEHVAWGESSAVLYVNAVLGGRTNREGGPTILAAGVTGKTPAYGFHLDENRHGTLKIIVSAKLEKETDYATLGYFAGRIAEDRVPILSGVPTSVSHSDLKCLGANMSVLGNVAHYHVVGTTPEAPTEVAASGGRKITSSDILNFGPKELRETEESISTASIEKADVVVLGCPHASIDQIGNYARALHGRRVKDRIAFWILSSHVIKQYATDIGYAQTIASAGARLVSNTCPGGMPRGFLRGQGHRVVATDSPKMAYYASTTQNISCYYGNLGVLIGATTSPR